MSDPRRFQLDELTIRPGTYFNPQTEVLVIVDDSPEVDHEIFESEEFDATDWVLIADEAPVDEHRRDQLIEQFRVTYAPGGELLVAGDDEIVEDEDRRPRRPRAEVRMSRSTARITMAIAARKSSNRPPPVCAVAGAGAAVPPRRRAAAPPQLARPRACFVKRVLPQRASSCNERCIVGERRPRA
jgi:hypothetical protein